MDVVCCAYTGLYIHDVLGNMLKEERKTNLFPEIVQLKMQHLFVVVGGKRTATHAERNKRIKKWCMWRSISSKEQRSCSQ